MILSILLYYFSRFLQSILETAVTIKDKFLERAAGPEDSTDSPISFYEQSNSGWELLLNEK